MPSVQRVLLIEDDRLQFVVTGRLLAKARTAHFEVDWAQTFEEGLRLLLTGAYAACLLDFQLGRRNGLELLREARKAQCDTPVIFLTADSSDDVDEAAMEAGAADYLVKGEITPRMLERSIRYSLKLADTFRQLKELATRDELTGLINRREFDRLLAEETDRARRFGRPLGLILCDLDHFKSVNDTHGHPAGDAVLKAVAAALRGGMRSIDRVARIGGEEFALLLTEMAAADAFAAAERLVTTVRGLRIPVPDGSELAVTLSAGVVVFPVSGDGPAALVKAADRALYAAKRAGRDRAVPV